MTLVHVPGQIMIQIDPAALPPGPVGPAGGAVRQHIAQYFPPGASTSSVAYVGTGCKIAIIPQADAKVRVQASGQVSHASPEYIVHFAFARDGVVLLPAGISGVSAVRCQSPDYAYPFHATLIDQPGVYAPLEYELVWRVHSGTAHMGKRPADATINVQTLVEIMEIAP